MEGDLINLLFMTNKKRLRAFLCSSFNMKILSSMDKIAGARLVLAFSISPSSSSRACSRCCFRHI